MSQIFIRLTSCSFATNSHFTLPSPDMADIELFPYAHWIQRQNCNRHIHVQKVGRGAVVLSLYDLIKYKWRIIRREVWFTMLRFALYHILRFGFNRPGSRGKL